MTELEKKKLAFKELVDEEYEADRDNGASHSLRNAVRALAKEIAELECVSSS